MSKRKTNNQIFISYSRNDSGSAQILLKYLIKKGYPVWIDRENINPGDNVALSIEVALDNSSDIIKRVSKYMGLTDFNKEKKELIEYFVTWKGEWIALINSIIEKCVINC